jgi:hypothetical protein
VQLARDATTIWRMTHDQIQQVDAIIQRSLAQVSRNASELERQRRFIVDRPWFPWVAMPCAVAVGVAVALAMR